MLAAGAMTASAETMVSASSTPLAIETLDYVVVYKDSGEVSVLWTSALPPYIGK
jgi:tRNA(His) 5'-end guanylyltransferase